LICADDVILGEIMNTVQKSTEALSEASGVVGLEVNAEKTKYMVVTHYKNAGHNGIY
jgi:hypothetical protein